MTDMNGKVCIVTGSNSGIGKETALALAEMGATVVMAVRDAEKGENARTEILEQTGNTKTDLMICDLASLDSIRQFAKEFTQKYDRLDVLVNNAGCTIHKRQVTNDGFERTLAVNYLGPFLLTHELLPMLKSSAPSRVVNLTSGIHSSARVDFDDLQNERKYRAMNAYGAAKLMVVMYTYELARRLEGTGVSVNAVHPGFAATNLGSNTGALRHRIMFKMVRPLQISAKKGAETSVYVATSPELEGVTGKYFAKSEERPSSELSYDEEAQKRLWVVTEELLGLA